NRVDDVSLLGLVKLRIHRQRDSFSSRALRLRKCSFFVAEITETFLPVKGDRVINFGTDAALLQMFHQRIAMTWDANHILVKDVPAIRPHKRRGDLKT